MSTVKQSPEINYQLFLDFFYSTFQSFLIRPALHCLHVSIIWFTTIPQPSVNSTNQALHGWAL